MRKINPFVRGQEVVVRQSLSPRNGTTGTVVRSEVDCLIDFDGTEEWFHVLELEAVGEATLEDLVRSEAAKVGIQMDDDRDTFRMLLRHIRANYELRISALEKSIEILEAKQ